MSKIIKKGIKIELLPDEAMVNDINQNICNARFVWNNLLSTYNNLHKLFSQHNCPLKPTLRNFNAILMMLKKEHPFLYDGESTSQQQVFVDLNNAFNRFFKGISGYPKFKSKKHSKKSFRIQKNGNNIRITNRCIRLAKLGYIHYHTSKKYKKILKSSKINNVTVKHENGKYYAIVNITTTVEEFDKTGENIGIDLGFKSLAIFNNSLKIDNLDLKKEDQMISKYQKKLARQEYMSKNYKKTLNKIHKWQNRKNNKKQNEYHHLSKQIVKKFDIISMENLNIAGMFQNKKWSAKLQKISLSQLVSMIKYKSQWYGKTFIQIGRFFPSTQICSTCSYQNTEITIDIRNWVCPKCGTTHDRDVNAAKNILNEGLRILKTQNKIK